jgi:hypothetical protein
MRYVIAVAASFLLGGCATTASKLKAQFARERSCPEDEVRVFERGGVVYEATGCGQRAEYVCSAFANAGPRASCEERGLSPKTPPGREPPQFPERPERIAPVESPH